MRTQAILAQVGEEHLLGGVLSWVGLMVKGVYTCTLVPSPNRGEKDEAQQRQQLQDITNSTASTTPQRSLAIIEEEESAGSKISVSVQNMNGIVLWGPAEVSPDTCADDLRRFAAEGWPISVISLLHGQCVLCPCVTLTTAGVKDGAVLTLVKSCRDEVVVSIPVRPRGSRRVRVPHVADWFMQHGSKLPCSIENEVPADLFGDEGDASMVVKIGPGIYRIIDDTTVNCAPSNLSRRVHNLHTGETVRVVTVLFFSEEDRVRGIIEKPVQGWISLCGTIFGRAWVEPLPDTTCEIE